MANFPRYGHKWPYITIDDLWGAPNETKSHIHIVLHLFQDIQHLLTYSRSHIHMWQSQVENVHYSYHFLTTFLTLQCCNCQLASQKAQI